MGSRLWVVQSPLSVIEGENFSWSIVYTNHEIISGTPAVKVYKSGDDITDDVVAGVASVSGNVVTLPEISIGENDGGEKYVISVSAIADGSTRIVNIQLNVQKRSDEQT